MAHPILTAAVERALAQLDALEAEPASAESAAVERLWRTLDAIRAELRQILQSVEAIQSEQNRLRHNDEQIIKDCFGFASSEARPSVDETIAAYGAFAFSDDALSRIAMTQLQAIQTSSYIRPTASPDE